MHRQVHDSRPQAMRPNFTDLSSVEKYELPTETYESLSNSVLAWKKNQKLGRFDPNALSPEQALQKQVEKDRGEVASKGMPILCSLITFFHSHISCRHCRVETGDHSALVSAAYPARHRSLCWTRADDPRPWCEW